MGTLGPGPRRPPSPGTGRRPRRAAGPATRFEASFNFSERRVRGTATRRARASSVRLLPVTQGQQSRWPAWPRGPRQAGPPRENAWAQGQGAASGARVRPQARPAGGPCAPQSAQLPPPAGGPAAGTVCTWEHESRGQAGRDRGEKQRPAGWAGPGPLRRRSRPGGKQPPPASQGWPWPAPHCPALPVAQWGFHYSWGSAAPFVRPSAGHTRQGSGGCLRGSLGCPQGAVRGRKPGLHAKDI